MGSRLRNWGSISGRGKRFFSSPLHPYWFSRCVAVDLSTCDYQPSYFDRCGTEIYYKNIQILSCVPYEAWKLLVKNVCRVKNLLAFYSFNTTSVIV
jgi:hypothetical protein